MPWSCTLGWLRTGLLHPSGWPRRQLFAAYARLLCCLTPALRPRWLEEFIWRDFRVDHTEAGNRGRLHCLSPDNSSKVEGTQSLRKPSVRRKAEQEFSELVVPKPSDLGVPLFKTYIFSQLSFDKFGAKFRRKWSPEFRPRNVLIYCAALSQSYKKVTT